MKNFDTDQLRQAFRKQAQEIKTLLDACQQRKI